METRARRVDAAARAYREAHLAHDPEATRRTGAALDAALALPEDAPTIRYPRSDWSEVYIDGVLYVSAAKHEIALAEQAARPVARAPSSAVVAASAAEVIAATATLLRDAADAIEAAHPDAARVIAEAEERGWVAVEHWRIDARGDEIADVAGAAAEIMRAARARAR